jgi:hypothetical protein
MILFDVEIEEVAKLIKPGARRRTEAYARLRPLAIVESVIQGNESQPTDRDLQRQLGRMANGDPWEAIFPGTAGTQIVADSAGTKIALHVTRDKGIPVQIVPDGTPGAAVILRRVDELGFYNLGLRNLASHLGLTTSMTIAVIRAMEIEKDANCFKEIVIGKSRIKRYSQKCIDRVKNALPNLDLQDVWLKHGPVRRKAANA